jgi:hypothetical protein
MYAVEIGGIDQGLAVGREQVGLGLAALLGREAEAGEDVGVVAEDVPEEAGVEGCEGAREIDRFGEGGVHEGDLVVGETQAAKAVQVEVRRVGERRAALRRWSDDGCCFEVDRGGGEHGVIERPCRRDHRFGQRADDHGRGQVGRQ